MNSSFAQFMKFVGSLPLSKKISISLVVLMIISGFIVMFFWANQEDYQILFNNLSPQDGGTIVEKLKEQNVPYQIDAGGGMIRVPANRVHELRLALAGDGLPGGGTVGFELFDNPDFRTTNFVQQLNYRRALQGELARTIMNFKEVKDASVFLAIPKESLFVEDEKQASASIQLNLESRLSSAKVEAIVRLVSNAVEGLDSGHVTVVDTRGRVIFKGDAGEEDGASGLGDSLLDYKKDVEKKIAANVQTMLEEVLGVGKAIVRVSAEIDTSEVVISEEEYDPTVVAVRSNKLIEESVGKDLAGNPGQGAVNERAGIVPSTGADGNQTRKSRNATTNYEINKISRRIVQPAGTVKRLSVAAVIDGVYKAETRSDGSVVQKYVPQDADALKMFEALVKNAMGYDEDREDQVSVQSVPFSTSLAMAGPDPLPINRFDPLVLLEKYGKTLFNLILILVAFFLVVRPLLKSVRQINPDGAEEQEAQGTLPPGEELKQISEPQTIDPRKRIFELTSQEPEKTAAVIRGWMLQEG